jgi:peptidyl-tRNA hydrolase
MNNNRSLVQPILVTLDASHEDIVTAVAHASVQVCSDRTVAPWSDWLDGPFTKTVRRIKEKSIPKIRELTVPYLEYTFGPNQSSVFAFEPMTYEEFPKPLKSAQVKGTEAPKLKQLSEELEVEEKRSKGTPLYLVNDSLAMSTGKTAAQVAHAHWMNLLALPIPESQVPQPNILWVSDEVFQKYSAPARFIVTDAGLTELKQSTNTVIVL